MVSELNDQGLSVKALTVGGEWIQMFEVKKSHGFPLFSQKAIMPTDLLERCLTIYFQYNDNRVTRVC